MHTYYKIYSYFEFQFFTYHLVVHSATLTRILPKYYMDNIKQRRQEFIERHRLYTLYNTDDVLHCETGEKNKLCNIPIQFFSLNEINFRCSFILYPHFYASHKIKKVHKMHQIKQCVNKKIHSLTKTMNNRNKKELV